MDTKKKIIRKLIALCMAMSVILSMSGQDIKQVKFCDKKYEYGVGKDSLTLYFNILNAEGKRVQNISTNQLQNYLVIKEDGSLIPSSSCKINAITSGQRIPAEYTFSVLVDLSIPQEGKAQIYKARFTKPFLNWSISRQKDVCTSLSSVTRLRQANL